MKKEIICASIIGVSMIISALLIHDAILDTRKEILELRDSVSRIHIPNQIYIKTPNDSPFKVDTSGHIHVETLAGEHLNIKEKKKN